MKLFDMNMAMLLEIYKQKHEEINDMGLKSLEMIRFKASQESIKELEEKFCVEEEIRSKIAIEIADRLTDIKKRQFNVSYNTEK